MTFSRAIVRRPCRAIINGLTSASLGRPDYSTALMQHDRYIEALANCGLEVVVMEADENYPDSVFIEDTALLTPHCAIITNPGAPSRRGETAAVADTVKVYFDNVEYIKSPGTVDAGDIMMTGSHFYIGLSTRTNKNGAGQVMKILGDYGLNSSIVAVEKELHLKSGVAYLENNNLIANNKFADLEDFRRFEITRVSDSESYAANCVCINGRVLLAGGFPEIKYRIESLGYETIELDVSEFRKLDGGLSCLSLRF